MESLEVPLATLGYCCTASRAHTTLSRFQEWPSPPRRHTHGCRLWTGSRLQIRTVVSSDAEAMRWGLAGDVARSLISYVVSRAVCKSGPPSPCTSSNLHHRAQRMSINKPRQEVSQCLSVSIIRNHIEPTITALPSFMLYTLILASRPATQSSACFVFGDRVHVHEQFSAPSWPRLAQVVLVRHAPSFHIHRHLGSHG